MRAGLEYMLDTNAAARVRQLQGSVSQRLPQVGSDAVAVSIIVSGEVRFGLARAGSER